MRVAVISDIHSNLHALKEVERAIEDAGIDEVICAGDTVGYGAFPNECCEIVERIADHVIAGNHDIAVIAGNTASMNPYAAEAARWTAKELNEGSRSFLKSLKTQKRLTVDGKDAALFHGSPKSVWEYLYEEDIQVQMLDSLKADLLVLGHTHVPYIKSFGDRFVLNPGAVGQPRDGDRRASFAVMDTATGDLAIKRIDYDIEGAAEAITKADLPQMLADRLFSGF